MDLQLSSLRADAVRRYPIDGLKVNGHDKDLVLLVRWSGSKDYVEAEANQAFQKLEGKARDDARNKLIARLLVVGWDCVPLAGAGAKEPDVIGKPLVYTPERGTQIISAFEIDERADKMNRFLRFLMTGDNFEQRFADAGDLGNG